MEWTKILEDVKKVLKSPIFQVGAVGIISGISGVFIGQAISGAVKKRKLDRTKTQTIAQNLEMDVPGRVWATVVHLSNTFGLETASDAAHSLLSGSLIDISKKAYENAEPSFPIHSETLTEMIRLEIVKS